MQNAEWKKTTYCIRFFSNFAKNNKAKRMKTMHKFASLLLLAGVLGLCNCGPKLPELPVENVKPYFADAAKTKAIDTAYYEVKDAKGIKLGKGTDH